MLAVEEFPLVFVFGLFGFLLFFFLVAAGGDLVEFGFVEGHVDIDYLVGDRVDGLVPVALFLVLSETFHDYGVAFLHILRNKSFHYI